MRVLAICRGAPGLGRVVPSLGLVQTLAHTGPVTARFVSYAAGASYLAAIGQEVVDLGRPSGQFIDPITPQASRVRELVRQDAPDLALVDGEYLMPAVLADLGVGIVFLANPHDLLGGENAFRRAHRSLLVHADAVLISSLGCRRPALWPGLVAGTPCLEVPAIIKRFPAVHHDVPGPPRVLISTGGGSIGADPALLEGTDAALAVVLDAVAEQAAIGAVASATVVLGVDATLPAVWRPVPAWLTVVDRPTELAAMYADHDLLIARAGRNTAAEALYCGIASMLLPIAADPHRASEQVSNTDTAGAAAAVFPLHNWRDAVMVRHVLARALHHAQTARRRPGASGNEIAAAFVTRMGMRRARRTGLPVRPVTERKPADGGLGPDLPRVARHSAHPAG